MSGVLFELARQKFLGGTLDWDTQTFSTVLMDLNTADVGVKAITSSTNATPIVVTVTSHGFANGDLVYLADHVTNTAANGVWRIANQATNTFELTNPVSGVNSVGNGVGGATGYVVNLGPSAVSDFWDDYNGTLVGAKVNLTGNTIVAGVADANDPTHTSVTGATVEAIGIIRDTGSDATSEMVALITGRQIVTCNTQAAASATTVLVEPLVGAIPNGTVLAFSNGASATLSALANAGDRSLAVTSLAAIITAGSRALSVVTGSGLPVTPNGGNIVIAFDSGTNRIFKL